MKNVNKKKTVLIYALSRSPWIGGLYYKKNIVHMMLSNKGITGKYNITVLTNDKYKYIFDDLGNMIDIIACPDKTGLVYAAWVSLKCFLKYDIQYIFPIKPYPFFHFLGITPVSWIADFQHNCFPNFFSREEIKKRNADFSYMAKKENPLVLSSNAALEDFKKFYKADRKNVHVIHFSSFINTELSEIDKIDNEEILKKYGLLGQKYSIVCNQFWKHKNHSVVFEALKVLENAKPHFKMQIVMTGEPDDRRNPEYYQELMDYLKNDWIKGHVKILGFISRTDQLCLMKHAEFVIQPSLFEGWGTVVEDAKILGKRIILSDIEVHREQMNNTCVLFDPKNPSDLADKINNNIDLITKEDSPCDLTVEYAKSLGDVFR